MSTSLIAPAISFIVLLSNVVFLLALVLFVFSLPTRSRVSRHLSSWIAHHIFIFSGVAMLGSLALSNIVGFPACELCWWQRIFMYPQVVISFVAWLRKETQFIYYCLPLSIAGAAISLYQSYIQWGGGASLLKCTLAGGDCAKLYVDAYGYITIPFMAFSAFAYLISISLIYIHGRKEA